MPVSGVVLPAADLGGVGHPVSGGGVLPGDGEDPGLQADLLAPADDRAGVLRPRRPRLRQQ